MPTAEKFSLLGAGNGWASSRGPGNVNPVFVRPYQPPSEERNYIVGFEKFCTLGGYTDSDSGPPTQKQLDESLENAMKLFYNAYEGGASSASADLPGLTGASVSSSISSSVFKDTIADTATGISLSPKDRAIASINGKDSDDNAITSNRLFGNSAIDDFGIPESSTGSSARCGPYKIQIVSLFDGTNSDDPFNPQEGDSMFLGYGLISHAVAEGSAGVDNVGVGATSSIGSYFNKTIADEFNETDSDISTQMFGNIPLLKKNEAIVFDESGELDGKTVEATSNSAEATIDDGYELKAECSMSPSYTFYTY